MFEPKGSPLVFKTTHRASFLEADPFGHVNTQHYLAYFLDHRFTGLRETIGWGLKEIAKLPIYFVVSHVQIAFIRPLLVDDGFTVESHVDHFADQTCLVKCEMRNEANKIVATCEMQLTCVDRTTNRAASWPLEVVQPFFQEVQA